MSRSARTAQFGTDVAIEALGGTVAAIAIGWLGQIPALFGLIGGAVLARQVESTLHRRRIPPPPEPPQGQPAASAPPPLATKGQPAASAPPPPVPTAEPSGPAGGPPASGSGGPQPRRRFITRSSLLITFTAVLIVIVSFTVIELARGSSLIGDRETTFPTPKPKPETVTVPRVVGLPEAAARRILHARGFDVAIAAPRFSAHPPGNVAATSPGGGRPADEGSLVKLSLSLGEGAQLPDLRNLPAGEARTELEELGLTVVERGEYDTAQIGSVIRTEPQGPDTVAKNSTVIVVASLGEGVQLPDLRNVLAADARTQLEGLGLTVVEQRDDDAEVELGDVIRTEPEGPSTVGKDSTVTIVVSLGPGVTVPMVAGQLLAQAQATLAAEGFALGGVTSEPSEVVPQGAVIRSDPVGGEQEAPGTPVTLTVSSGPP